MSTAHTVHAHFLSLDIPENACMLSQGSITYRVVKLSGHAAHKVSCPEPKLLKLFTSRYIPTTLRRSAVVLYQRGWDGPPQCGSVQVTGLCGAGRSLLWRCAPAAAAHQGCSNTGGAAPHPGTSSPDHPACWQVWRRLGAALVKGQYSPGESCDHL